MRVVRNAVRHAAQKQFMEPSQPSTPEDDQVGIDLLGDGHDGMHRLPVFPSLFEVQAEGFQRLGGSTLLSVHTVWMGSLNNPAENLCRVRGSQLVYQVRIMGNNPLARRQHFSRNLTSFLARRVLVSTQMVWFWASETKRTYQFVTSAKPFFLRYRHVNEAAKWD